MNNNEIQLIIAHKYAKAFVNVFKDKIDLKDIEKLQSMQSYLEENRNLFVYFKLTVIDKSVKKEAFDKLLALFELSNIYSDLTYLLIKDNRVQLIIYVIKEIIKVYKDYNNIMEFNILTSDKLSQNNLDYIKEFLKYKTNKKIIIKEQIDKSLIAGLKIYSDELEWQHSIRNDLNMLKNTKYIN
ncbi:MAG: F0F1 ATP synthase subunit delta [Novosphingobium sp.]|nr:F0F1 ATP synthase subunit delta [Novosphingobium sp.]